MTDGGWMSSPPGKKPKPDSRIDKWKGWLDTIETEILAMHAHRDVYREVGRIVDEHGALPPSHFFDYLGHWYATTQSTAVRRQADTDPRVVSLGRLLSEIQGDSERFSREWFVGQYPQLDETHANKVFDEEFAGEVGTHLDPKVVATDLDTLEKGAQRVADHVDKHIAHTDRKGLDQPLTFEELNAAIDAISELFKKYTLLLTVTSWATLVPVPQYDWLAIFREPWIKGVPG